MKVLNHWAVDVLFDSLNCRLVCFFFDTTDWVWIKNLLINVVRVYQTIGKRLIHATLIPYVVVVVILIYLFCSCHENENLFWGIKKILRWRVCSNFYLKPLTLLFCYDWYLQPATFVWLVVLFSSSFFSQFFEGTKL